MEIYRTGLQGREEGGGATHGYTLGWGQCKGLFWSALKWMPEMLWMKHSKQFSFNCSAMLWFALQCWAVVSISCQFNAIHCWSLQLFDLYYTVMYSKVFEQTSALQSISGGSVRPVNYFIALSNTLVDWVTKIIGVGAYCRHKRLTRSFLGQKKPAPGRIGSFCGEWIL